MATGLVARAAVVVNSDVHSIVVGTAGHIDHGKSALVRALTGTDPDRLKEEKERGITIDLGFAHTEVGPGTVASFIDVPGHERFVRNMLAGSHGIDAVLMVVAADESVMPQTKEHFHICRLLGVGAGLVALTKRDLVDADVLHVAASDVRDLVAGSFLEGCPILPVSTRTGEGMDALRSALLDMAALVETRPAEGPLRIPVDRAFTMRGFGTVATGTVVSGRLALGDEVEILPEGRRARVRGLQVHGEPVEAVLAGSRAAVNLAGVETVHAPRGAVLARPGELRATWLLDGEATLLAEAPALEDGTRARIHVGSAEVLGRLRVLGGEQVDPGGSALVQLRLERPVVAGRGDRLILRSYSPAATIGGVRVVDPLPPKRRRAGREAVERLRAAGDDLSRLAACHVAEAGPTGIDAGALAARLSISEPALRGVVGGQPEVVELGQAPRVYVGREALGALGDAALGALDDFHRQQPLRASMPREELRKRVFAHAPEDAFARVLADLAAQGTIQVDPSAVARAGHRVRLDAGEAEARELLLRAALESGLSGIVVDDLAQRTGQDRRRLERVARVLGDEGLLLRVGDAFLVHRERLDALKADVRRRWPPGTRLDVGEFKDLTGLTRKFVIPLLEFLDRERVTRRAGNDRQVLA